MITDNGPEYIATDFRAALAAKEIRHVRIPPRSPNHNAVVERFHGTTSKNSGAGLHRRRFISRRQLQAAADVPRLVAAYQQRYPDNRNHPKVRVPTDGARGTGAPGQWP